MIAGAGDMPVDLAARMAAEGKPYFIIRIADLADPRLEAHPGVTLGIGQFGRTTRYLRERSVDRLFFSGKVARPRWSRFSLDWAGFLGVLRLMRGAWFGDDTLQRAIVKEFERGGVRVVGPAELWPDLLMPAGLLAGHMPDEGDWRDIRLAA